MSQETAAVQEMIETNYRHLGSNDRFAIPFFQYQRLSVHLGHEGFVGRFLSVMILIATFAIQPSKIPTILAFLSVASIVIASYWWLSVNMLETRMKNLERLLLQDSGLPRQVMIEWRFDDDLKFSKKLSLLRLEPFVWSILTILCAIFV